MERRGGLRGGKAPGGSELQEEAAEDARKRRDRKGLGVAVQDPVLVLRAAALQRLGPSAKAPELREQ